MDTFMKDTPDIVPASAEDTRAAHAIPSTLVNRFHLTAGDQIMRITFGEQVGPDAPTAYHHAVTLPRNEAIMLGQMILQMYQAAPVEPKTH
jgi:hypothetical protein